ncbi:hypothetical protein [Micromonospora sp. NPDC048898]|uniref:hypothetical protein n=1 Tax=Micromonospora sp. NPDC048898 TaxID=3364260 RepID=UPI0037195EBE
MSHQAWTIAAEPRISLGWGAPEIVFTPAVRTALDELFADAAALGITVVAAAGDEGSASGLQDGGSHVMFPAGEPVRPRLRRNHAAP